MSTDADDRPDGLAGALRRHDVSPKVATVKRRVRMLAASVAVAVFAVGCGGAARPDEQAWAVLWNERRDAVPTADELLEGGEQLCASLLPEVRDWGDDLLPAPDEALDGTVRAWVAAVETLAFECTDDRTALDAQLVEVAVLSAEIDAGFGRAGGG